MPKYTPDECRRHAASCMEAVKFAPEQNRSALVQAAKQWLQLAKESEALAA